MNKKSSRPFIGVVFLLNGYRYYAPLTSPKAKHIKMKNQVDFLKIQNGEFGVINFNNMIPVHSASLSKIDIKPCKTDTREEIAYKNLLSNQLSWCNAHKKQILKQAEKLYNLITSEEAWDSLVKRCCDFKTNENRYLEYERGQSHIMKEEYGI